PNCVSRQWVHKTRGPCRPTDKTQTSPIGLHAQVAQVTQSQPETSPIGLHGGGIRGKAQATWQGTAVSKWLGTVWPSRSASHGPDTAVPLVRPRVRQAAARSAQRSG